MDHMVGVARFELTNAGVKVPCLTAWLYPKNFKVVRPEGFEPPTPALEGRCSIQLSYGHVITFSRYVKFGAGDENRTHVASLEGWSSTIELHPHHKHCSNIITHQI